MNASPFGLSLSKPFSPGLHFDRLSANGSRCPFGLSLSKPRTTPPFRLSLSKPFDRLRENGTEHRRQGTPS
jgi:hypothetical protein